ncbi:MAG: hypothetical protein B7Y11_01730 [Sphingobacteriia bacterium 24-36-13]|jgi:hypothetical protein|uniref:hypothetical protein n=1 Tax=Chitinophagaceae TaxID=563835 RepID=UPI000BD3B1A5|nr:MULTISPECIES: hypothetical protein [Chitinophagaceae]OYZ55364.1 MAG: hypothetical protein B7Y11_01730 [Sphingobacteriia bacterium 24-36-13]OZA66324.1 MAG: hypothetical protein B7X68_01215 [Sphingobacteriia bacterium 39-36-14]RWZ89479.1 MAG: hypothetical protein EO766_04605 [Hydrotalea sp. AMD]HQS22907.1 hypothetical protein [Sediminibacterium sp.]HQS33917.1 hypothetical protein [Sediminibacterium sp.]
MEALIKLLQGISYPTLFFAGLGIRLIVGMRQFNRRGLGGLQHFSNYFIGLITLSIEWILKWVAFFVMLWGVWGLLFK